MCLVLTDNMNMVQSERNNLLMSEERTIENTESEHYDPDQNEKPTLAGYKAVCAKLGLSMIAFFAFRIILIFTLPRLRGLSDIVSESIYYLIFYIFLILMGYVIPLLTTMVIFKSFREYKGKYRELYKRPKRLARAMGAFPASFGLGHGVVLLTMLVTFLIFRNFDGHSYIEELFRPTAMEPSTNLVSIIATIFMLVIIAPVFEEFWCRGIMYDALKPYGTGIAIIISSLLFGLMHGNLFMLFYTTAYGFALGYVRYATGSLFVVTIFHAIVNAIAAGALTIITLASIYPDSRLLNTIYYIYAIAFLVLIIVGIVVFITKIPKMRKYKIENAWPEKNPWKKVALFFVSIPVILMLVLSFNELSGFWLLGILIR